MSVGKDVLARRNRVGLQAGVLTCAKAGPAGVIARRMHPSVGQFKGCFNGSMTMVEAKQNHGCIIRATHIASARSSKDPDCGVWHAKPTFQSVNLYPDYDLIA